MSDKHLIDKIENYCVRCRTRPGVYSCANCDGHNIFCDQCDFYVHSISSKQQHQRSHISSISVFDKHETKEKSQSGQNFFKSYNNNNYNFEKGINASPNQLNDSNNLTITNHNVINHSKHRTNPKTLYDITSKSINKFSLKSLEKENRSISIEKLYDR